MNVATGIFILLGLVLSASGYPIGSLSNGQSSLILGSTIVKRMNTEITPANDVSPRLSSPRSESPIEHIHGGEQSNSTASSSRRTTRFNGLLAKAEAHKKGFEDSVNRHKALKRQTWDWVHKWGAETGEHVHDTLDYTRSMFTGIHPRLRGSRIDSEDAFEEAVGGALMTGIVGGWGGTVAVASTPLKVASSAYHTALATHHLIGEASNRAIHAVANSGPVSGCIGSICEVAARGAAKIKKCVGKACKAVRRRREGQPSHRGRQQPPEVEMQSASRGAEIV